MLVAGLRIWLALAGLLALYSAIQSYVNGSAITSKIYTNYTAITMGKGTSLTARLFGVWTTLSATVRLLAAADIRNKTIYLAAMASFAIAFVHFISETAIYETASTTPGLVIPVIVSGFSVAWMMVMLPFISVQSDERKKK